MEATSEPTSGDHFYDSSHRPEISPIQKIPTELLSKIFHFLVKIPDETKNIGNYRLVSRQFRVVIDKEKKCKWLHNYHILTSWIRQTKNQIDDRIKKSIIDCHIAILYLNENNPKTDVCDKNSVWLEKLTKVKRVRSPSTTDQKALNQWTQKINFKIAKLLTRKKQVNEAQEKIKLIQGSDPYIQETYLAADQAKSQFSFFLLYKETEIPIVERVSHVIDICNTLSPQSRKMIARGIFDALSICNDHDQAARIESNFAVTSHDPDQDVRKKTHQISMLCSSLSKDQHNELITNTDDISRKNRYQCLLAIKILKNKTIETNSEISAAIEEVKNIINALTFHNNEVYMYLFEFQLHYKKFQDAKETIFKITDSSFLLPALSLLWSAVMNLNENNEVKEFDVLYRNLCEKHHIGHPEVEGNLIEFYLQRECIEQALAFFEWTKNIYGVRYVERSAALLILSFYLKNDQIEKAFELIGWIEKKVFGVYEEDEGNDETTGKAESHNEDKEEVMEDHEIEEDDPYNDDLFSRLFPFYCEARYLLAKFYNDSSDTEKYDLTMQSIFKDIDENIDENEK
nr:hypothetical protein [Chlamydiota bacterium]